MNKPEFKLYMDANTKLYGISDQDGNIIVEAEYKSADDMKDMYSVLVEGEGDNMSIDDKNQFIEDYGIETLQVCDNCGNFMHEGYTLAGEHACCDECAIALYVDNNGNILPNAEELFNQDLEENDEECYWTAWEG